VDQGSNLLFLFGKVIQLGERVVGQKATLPLFHRVIREKLGRLCGIFCPQLL